MLLMSWGLTGLYRSFIDPPSPQTIHSCILDSLRINGAFAAMVLSSNIKNPIILRSQFELPQPDYCNQKILIWSNICPTAQFTLMRVKVLPRLYGVSHSLHWKTCCIRLYLFIWVSIVPTLASHPSIHFGVIDTKLLTDTKVFQYNQITQSFSVIF